MADVLDTPLARLLHARGRLPLDLLRAALGEARAERADGATLAVRLVARGLLPAEEVEALVREVAVSAEGPAAAITVHGGAPGAGPTSEAGGWAPGAVVGEHRLVRRLGAGGMAVVHEAEHLQTGAHHALKSLPATTDPDLLLRFRREGEALARVDRHPNVVRVHALGQALGRQYLVMDLLGGGDLLARLRDGPLSPRAAVDLGVALCQGLAHVHRHGVLHRDLKPANVLFDGPAPGGRPCLTDFGLARATGAGSLTATGEVLGTPAYMAPEQALGQRDALGPTTDVYGLGALLFHALTGAAPFAGASPFLVLAKVAVDLPPSPRALVPAVPAALDAVVRRAMAKRPVDRYPSAEALGAALAASLAAPVRRVPRGLVAAASVALIAVTGALVWQAAARPVGDTTDGSPRLDSTPPVVGITGPVNGSTTTDEQVTLQASVTDASPWADLTLTLTGATTGAPRTVRVVRDQAYSERVTLALGETTLVLASVDAAGNRGADVRLRVTREPSVRLPAGLSRLPAGVSAGRREGEWAHDKTGIVLVWVPPGTFRMGSDAGYSDEKPVHEVRLTRGFFVGQCEVTWGQYRAYCRAAGVAEPAAAIGQVDDRHPVVNVSWDDAQGFCRWAGLRLPTEAEWEWAARGTDGRTYPWGNEDPGTTRCNLEGTGDGFANTAPVGLFPTGASPVGALDMTGNVWEWCQDRYGTYSAGAQADPPGATSGTDRALRGGSWRNSSTDCRASDRFRSEPGNLGVLSGFRAVLSPPQ